VSAAGVFGGPAWQLRQAFNLRFEQDERLEQDNV
jgi:hypothetical protein